MGCLCIGADNKDAKVGAETRDARAPRQVSNRMSTRVDNQTEVKRVLAQTATEGEIYEDYQFGATLGEFLIRASRFSFMPTFFAEACGLLSCLSQAREGALAQRS